MSSLKNAVHRREHRERSQPLHRQKLGLLEKKKDYKLRAKDFQKKQAALTTLRRKADERNPDEFYFAMQRSRTERGVHTTKGRGSEANKYSAEELALMRTQDSRYLGLKARTEAGKVARLRAGLSAIEAARPSNHVVFVDDDDEARAFDPAAFFDTPAELLGRTFNRPRRGQLAQGPAALAADALVRPRGRDGGEGAPGDAADGEEGPSTSAARATALGRLMAEKAARRVAASYRELGERTERARKLARLSSEADYSRQVAGKGRKRKLSEDETGSSAGKVFRWKQERKR